MVSNCPVPLCRFGSALQAELRTLGALRQRRALVSAPQREEPDEPGAVTFAAAWRLPLVAVSSGAAAAGANHDDTASLEALALGRPQPMRPDFVALQLPRQGNAGLRTAHHDLAVDGRGRLVASFEAGDPVLLVREPAALVRHRNSDEPALACKCGVHESAPPRTKA